MAIRPDLALELKVHRISADTRVRPEVISAASSRLPRCAQSQGADAQRARDDDPRSDPSAAPERDGDGHPTGDDRPMGERGGTAHRSADRGRAVRSGSGSAVLRAEEVGTSACPRSAETGSDRQHPEDAPEHEASTEAASEDDRRSGPTGDQSRGVKRSVTPHGAKPGARTRRMILQISRFWLYRANLKGSCVRDMRTRGEARRACATPATPLRARERLRFCGGMLSPAPMNVGPAETAVYKSAISSQIRIQGGALCRRCCRCACRTSCWRRSTVRPRRGI